jgi:hypothetical protein
MKRLEKLISSLNVPSAGSNTSTNQPQAHNRNTIGPSSALPHSAASHHALPQTVQMASHQISSGSSSTGAEETSQLAEGQLTTPQHLPSLSTLVPDLKSIIFSYVPTTEWKNLEILSKNMMHHMGTMKRRLHNSLAPHLGVSENLAARQKRFAAILEHLNPETAKSLREAEQYLTVNQRPHKLNFLYSNHVAKVLIATSRHPD